MLTLLLASVAFSVGGALMKPSGGLTRFGPSVAVIGCFIIGAAFLTRAVHHGNLSTTYVLGLGMESLVAAGVGLFVLHEEITSVQAGGLVLVVGGIALLHL
jgi:multidrug transporter EmrE-like cation transporter